MTSSATSSATSTTSAGGDGITKRKSLRKRLGLSKKKDEKQDDHPTSQEQAHNNSSTNKGTEAVGRNGGEDRSASRSRRRLADDNAVAVVPTSDRSIRSSSSSAKRSSRGSRMAEGVMKRVRSLSRSRSNRGNGSDTDSSSDSGHHRSSQKTIVTVTSCRSDGYYNQKAPGSTSKLPRKAPTNLKLFHELAVGLKDAYAAIGQTPIKPEKENEENGEKIIMSDKEFHGRTVLWEFIGNIDFVRNNKTQWMDLCLLDFYIVSDIFWMSAFVFRLIQSCWHWWTKWLLTLPPVVLSRTIQPSRV